MTNPRRAAPYNSSALSSIKNPNFHDMSLEKSEMRGKFKVPTPPSFHGVFVQAK